MPQKDILYTSLSATSDYVMFLLMIELESATPALSGKTH